MISIKGLNKAEVLKSLYDHSHVQGYGFLQAVPDGFVTVSHCEELLERSTYFDYLYGKVLKVDLSGDEFDERLYDRDCGLGAAQRAINDIRRSKKAKNTEGCKYCRGVVYTSKPLKVITVLGREVEVAFSYCPVCGNELPKPEDGEDD